MSKLQHALALAQQGFRIFPLSPDTKKPLGDLAWKSEATADPDKINEWWQAEPRCNIGVATGNGTIVIDADTKEGKPGLASLGMLDLMDLPGSYRVETPSGGVHVYLKTNEAHRNRVDSIPGFEGIDIRSDGGYVVGPGSIVDHESYEVVRKGRIEQTPKWFDDLLLMNRPSHTPHSENPLVELDTPENLAKAQEWLVNMAEEAIEGAGGNQATYQVACRCRDFGISEDRTLELMLDHWNEEKASPPRAPDELGEVVQNAYRYASGGWGAATAAAEFEVLDIDVGASPMAAPLLHLNGSILEYGRIIDVAEPEWLIEDIALEKSGVLMFGKSNAHKSFLAIDMALSVAAGRPWHGKPVKQGKVLFVITEGTVGVRKRRIPGWLDQYEVPRKDRDNVFLLPSDIALDEKKHADFLIEGMKKLGINLLVLDIFGGTMLGSETEDTTARAWVGNLQRIIKETGATVLTVAHTGWADSTRARMHTHFWGSFDSRLKVEGDKDARTSVMTIDRHKDADSTGQYSFQLEVAHDTLVPVLDDTIRPSRAHWPDSLKTALRALESAISEAGAVRHDEGFPLVPVAPVDVWRDRCIDKGITSSDKPSAQRKAFHRAMRELQDREAIVVNDGSVWNAEELSLGNCQEKRRFTNL